MGKVDKYFVASSIHGPQVLSEETDERAGNYYKVHENCDTLKEAEAKALELNKRKALYKVEAERTGKIPWDFYDYYTALPDDAIASVREAFTAKWGDKATIKNVHVLCYLDEIVDIVEAE